MKKRGFLLALLLSLGALLPLRAQNTVLGERVPEIRGEHWLHHVQPVAAPLTAITFFTASNPSCVKALAHLYALQEQSGSRLRVLVITRDEEAQAEPAMEPYLSPHMALMLDPEGKLFKSFGVSYVPFTLLVNDRNRLLWQGNAMQLTEKLVSTAQ